MYVEPGDENPASNPLEDISRDLAAGPITAYSGAATPPAGSYDLSDIEERLRYVPIQEATLGVPGSVGVFTLQEKEKLKPFPSTAPSEEFGRFVDAFMSHLAASLSIPLEVVLMKFGQNYSASRAALILFWRVAQIWRQELAVDLLRPIYTAWLAGEVSSGRVTAPGWVDPKLREGWTQCEWSGVPMPNIDPMKTAKSDQIYVEMGAQTLQHVAQDLNGSDIEENKVQLSRELEDLPVPPWGSGGAVAGGRDVEDGDNGES